MKKLFLALLLLVANCNAQTPQPLPNYGCACYFNAAIQSLYTIQPLNQIFRTNQCDYEHAMVQDYCELVQAFPSNNYKEIHKTFFELAAQQMGNMGQQDVDEFFDTFLKQVKEENKLQDFTKKNLGYELQFSITCPESFTIDAARQDRINQYKQDEINKHRNIFKIPLSSSLSDSFDQFFSVKQSTNPLLPDCTEQLQLTKAPKVLFVALYRFKDDGTKISTPITIPLTFDAKNVLRSNNNFEYELTAALIQQGDRSGGHYIAYVLQNNIWYLCNDSAIKPVTDLSEINSGYAYIYQKKKRPLPTPPTQEQQNLKKALTDLQKALNDLQNALQSNPGNSTAKL